MPDSGISPDADGGTGTMLGLRGVERPHRTIEPLQGLRSAPYIKGLQTLSRGQRVRQPAQARRAQSQRLARK